MTGRVVLAATMGLAVSSATSTSDNDPMPRLCLFGMFEHAGLVYGERKQLSFVGWAPVEDFSSFAWLPSRIFEPMMMEITGFIFNSFP